MLSLVFDKSPTLFMVKALRTFRTAEGCLVESEKRAALHDGYHVAAGHPIEHVVLSAPDSIFAAACRA